MSLPETMTAIEIASPGGPEQLVAVERPVPIPQPGELLVRVAAAGVNRPDVIQRQGLYPPPPGASDLPGLEIAGEVVGVGPETKRYAPGDLVTALTNGGGYATYCVVPETSALPVPAGLDMISAAALPETLFTVWHNVFERGGLQAGERLLVHGGGSGIGTMAIMMANCLGAETIVTAGSDEKCARCMDLGAAHTINYREQDFTETIDQLTDGNGVDLILDMVGGDYLNRNLEALAVEGRVVQIAFLQGRTPPIDLSLIMRKRLTLTGSMLRSRSDADKGAMAQAIEKWAWPHVAAGKITPVIDTVYPLADASKAHAHMENGTHFGKIMLTVQ